MKIYVYVTVLISFFFSCNQYQLPCGNCDNDKLNFIWSYPVKGPYKELHISDNLLYFQDIDKNAIVFINKKNGAILNKIKNYTSEGNKGSFISIKANSKLMVYEKIINAQKSYIMIYDMVTFKLKDSIRLSVSNDYSSFKSDQKLSCEPVLNDDLVLYALCDGTFNCYNIKLKKVTWSHAIVEKGVVKNQPLIIGKNIYVAGYSDGVFGHGSTINSISCLNGKINWKAYKSDLTIPLISKKGRILGIDDNNRLFSLDPSNGHISVLMHIFDNPLSIEDIENTDLLAVSARNKKIAIINCSLNKVQFSLTPCDEVYGMDFSTSLNSLITQDESGRLNRINLDTKQSQCLSDHLNVFSSFVVNNDTVYVNNYSQIASLKLEN